MDFDLPPEAETYRADVCAWIEANPKPSPVELAEAGYVVPHWPKPWGLDASPIQQLVIDEELKRAGIVRPQNQIGIGWAGPTLLHAGTPEQIERYIPKIISGEEIWCQLFSEPGAGSDLANLALRAERDGDEYVVNGQKIWTSFAQIAEYGILIARTNPDVAKHEGVSYFICPMDVDGIEIRPIVEMTGEHLFNEVFFDDVRIPAENLVGEENKGWPLAKITLGNERVSLSGEGALWGMGPTAKDLLDWVVASGGEADPRRRQQLAALYAEAEVLRLIRLRTVSAAVAGREPGPEASIRKALADEHGQHVFAEALGHEGAYAMLSRGSFWQQGFLFSPALTIGGGTSEVQRNIIGERVLGLPKEPDPVANKTWAEANSASA